MQKTQAIELLGGSVATAAAAIGVTYQAVDKWPAELPDRIVDRVIAALVKSNQPVPLDLLRMPEAKAA